MLRVSRIRLLTGMLSLACLAGAGYAGDGALKESDIKKLYLRPRVIPHPSDNAPTPEREELGRQLFFDPRVSGSQVMSCATCHNPSFSWSDGLPKAVGHGHKTLARRTPTILNLAWADRLFWDGRAASLEEQALGPIQSEGEMNQPLPDLVKRIAETYKDRFAKAYPGEAITEKTLAKAIATFERKMISPLGPFDRWVNGDKKAISSQAVRGFHLFNEKAKCSACHSGWSFTDHSFHDIGLADHDVGRGKYLKLTSMQHAFKTPTLRGIDSRGPYMHDGSEESLAAVIALYNRGGNVKRDSLAPEIVPLRLTPEEQVDLLEFLKTLSAPNQEVALPLLPKSRAPASTEDSDHRREQ